MATVTDSAELTAEALQALQAICSPQRTLTRWLDRVAYASDASVYRLIPKAVVQPRSEAEVQALFGWSQRWRVPLTFRAAGTSLSGQAITDGVLVDLARHWGGIKVLDGGQRVWAMPGAIGGQINALLREHGRKIGPDPASIQACMLGGILANNASGMCCGVQQNAYHTLDSLRLILPCGSLIDSAEPEAQARFEAEHPKLHQGLLALRSAVLAQPALQARIRAKYRQKNTTGYSLNALLDFEQSLQILSHLMIGSEGTLGFIAAATLQTVPVLPCSATGLLFFADLEAACAAVSTLRQSGAAAIELMDAAAIASMPGEVLADWLQAHALPAEAALLLVEYQRATAPELAATLAAAHDCWQALPLCAPARMSQDPAEQARLWQLRKGLYPSVGAIRQRGSSVIIEDVVFPPAQLAAGARLLQQLFASHGYPHSIIFGHALDANLHFVMTPRFDSAADIARYQHFLEAMVQGVLVLGGALKAEHGTGRNMAPFVEAEWGPEALAIMQQLKDLLDPQHLLNPGVILNPSPLAHVAHLKSLPAIDPEVDACTECGFCEPACPSRRLSLTPRQRIVLRREQARLAAAGETQRLKQLQADYAYSGLATCAADSLCAMACPIGLDTGALVKRLRSEQAQPPAQPGEHVPQQLAPFWQQALGHGLNQGFGLISGGLRQGLRLWPALQTFASPLLPLAQQKLGGSAWPAHWAQNLPPAVKGPLPASARAGAEYVYFPSCLSRTLGYTNAPSLPESIMTLARKAAVPVWLPPGSRKHCCGLPPLSKGLPETARLQSRQTLQALWQWSRQGQLPIIMDTSPCTLHLQQSLKQQPEFSGLQIRDSVSWLADTVAPRLKLQQSLTPVILHPVCSLRKMGLEAQLESLARRCSSQVISPRQAGCCGFAGDRGLLYPELPQAALHNLQQELQSRELPADSRYVSCSRSCEMGLNLVLERPYRSVAHLLCEALL